MATISNRIHSCQLAENDRRKRRQQERGRRYLDANWWW